MKKRIIVIAATAVGALGILAGPAAAAPGDAPAYGKAWKACFGPYGQSVQAVAKGNVPGHSMPAVGVNVAYPVHAALCST